MGTLKPGATYIYESPDGGDTVYAREAGAPISERFIIGYSEKSLIANRELIEEKLWKEIRDAAKDNPSLQEALERVKMLYYMSKDND